MDVDAIITMLIILIKFWTMIVHGTANHRLTIAGLLSMGRILWMDDHLAFGYKQSGMIEGPLLTTKGGKFDMQTPLHEGSRPGRMCWLLH